MSEIITNQVVKNVGEQREDIKKADRDPGKKRGGVRDDERQSQSGIDW